MKGITHIHGQDCGICPLLEGYLSGNCWKIYYQRKAKWQGTGEMYMKSFVMPTFHVTCLVSESHRMGATCREHEETGNTFITLVLKSEKNGKFGKHRRTSEENMELNIWEYEFKYVQWLDISQIKACCGIVMKNRRTWQISQKQGISKRAEKLLRFQKSYIHLKVSY